MKENLVSIFLFCFYTFYWSNIVSSKNSIISRIQFKVHSNPLNCYVSIFSWQLQVEVANTTWYLQKKQKTPDNQKEWTSHPKSYCVGLLRADGFSKEVWERGRVSIAFFYIISVFISPVPRRDDGGGEIVAITSIPGFVSLYTCPCPMSICLTFKACIFLSTFCHSRMSCIACHMCINIDFK